MTTISSNRRPRVPWGRLAALGLLALIFVGAAFFRARLSSALLRSLEPVIVWRNSLDATENVSLRAQLASTTAALADRDALYVENQLLQQELGRSGGVPKIMALILQRPPGIPYDTLLIDAGQNDALAAGDLAYAGAVLVGTVTDVYATTARVTLFSAPGRSYSALIAGTIPVSIEGQGAGSMRGEVPAQTQVRAGDPVLFSGAAEGYTGSVSRVDAPAGESFETIYVQLPVDLFSLRYVVVAPKPL